MSDLKEILEFTFQKRNSLNARYSRNAFARDLGISPTALSQFLSGKRRLSPKNLKQVAASLYLPSEMLTRFKQNTPVESSATKIKLATFSVIADWYHYAILNLVEVDKIKSAAQVSRRLDISPETAKAAIERLLQLNFLKKENGLYRRLQNSLDAGTEIPSAALRKHNREKMELAIESLEKVPMQERDISSLTVTLDPAKMDQVKKEIQSFKKRINTLCGSDHATEVYSLNVQFFPLSKKESSK